MPLSMSELGGSGIYLTLYVCLAPYAPRRSAPELSCRRTARTWKVYCPALTGENDLLVVLASTRVQA
jgi:hypothetical protein